MVLIFWNTLLRPVLYNRPPPAEGGSKWARPNIFLNIFFEKGTFSVQYLKIHKRRRRRFFFEILQGKPSIFSRNMNGYLFAHIGF